MSIQKQVSHDAQDVDDGEGDHQKHQQGSHGVSDQDERQNQNSYKTQAEPLVQLFVDYLKRFPLEVAESIKRSSDKSGQRKGTKQASG